MKLTGKQKKKLEEKCAFHPEVDPEHMEEKFQEALLVERHIKYTKKIKLNARRHNVKFRSIQII